MKVKILEMGLIIEPETDFETDFLRLNFASGQNIKAYLSHGATVSHLIGLKIYTSKVNPPQVNPPQQIREGTVKQGGVAIRPPSPKPDVRPVAQKPLPGPGMSEGIRPQHRVQHKKPERRRLVDILDNKPDKPILMDLKGAPNDSDH